MGLDTNNYFNALDNYFLKKKIKKPKNLCCDNQLLLKDNYCITCNYCGTIKVDNFDFVIPNIYLNQKFHNCTLINQSTKFKNIRRLHHFQNYNYKEVTQNKSFVFIKNICELMGLSKTILEGAKIRYKEIFLDFQISSRSNIKNAMYCYCIFFSCEYYNYKVDVDELIKFAGIRKIHYTKVLKKLEKKNIINPVKKINKLISICNDNNIYVNKDELIFKYKILKKKKIKINNNSLLLGIIYDLIEIDEKDFISIFKTTKITLDKFNLLKILN